MRIVEFEIKNYLSIDKIKFNALDKNITCFIGRNGSGKSNILKALMCLKEYDSLEDTHSHLKEGNENEPIIISAKFIFEEKDSNLLSDNGLSGLNFRGFIVEVKKSKESPATRTFSYLSDAKVFIDKKKETDKGLSELKILIDQLSLPEDQQNIKTEIQNKLVGSENKTAEEVNALVEQIKSSVTPLGEIANNVLEKIELYKSAMNFTLEGALEKVFDNLQIVLLSAGGTFETYKVEEKANLVHLKTQEKHPFLSDLLELTKTTPEQHTSSLENNMIDLEEKASGRLTKAISRAWEKHQIKFVIRKSNKDTELYFAFRTPQENPVGLLSLSDGEKWFLRFYARLTVAKERGEQIIWLFDEPGKDLHAQSQLNLRDYFESFSDNSQIFYTTHNPMMLPWHRIERIFVVENPTIYEKTEKEDRSGTIVHNRIWKDNQLISPLREALGLIIGEELLSGDEHLIVEGPSDYLILQAWINFFRRKKEKGLDEINDGFLQEKRNLIPIHSVNNIPFYASFLCDQTKHKNWVAVADSGKKIQEVENKMNSLGIGHFKNRVANIGQLLGRVKTFAEPFDIEDVFKPEEYILEVKEFYLNENVVIQIPSDKEFQALSVGPQITKNIETVFRKKNPKFSSLDKAGIGQQIYRKLMVEEKRYSHETENNFKKILGHLNKTFELEPLKEEAVAFNNIQQSKENSKKGADKPLPQKKITKK